MLSVLVPFRVAVLPPFLQCVVVSLAAVAVVAAGAVRSSLPLSQMEGARARVAGAVTLTAAAHSVLSLRPAKPALWAYQRPSGGSLGDYEFLFPSLG